MRKLTQNPETIEEYSDALRQRLAGTLPPEKIEEVVAETQAHLEDSAADLRYQADVYERHAVAHFVPVRKMARGVSRAWAPTFLLHSGTKALQNASATLAVFCLTWGIISLSFASKFPGDWLKGIGPQIPMLLIPVLLPLALTFFLALAACRPQTRRFTFGGLAAIIACAFWGGWKFTGALPERTFQSRFNAPALHADITAASNLRSEEIALLRKGIKHYYKDYNKRLVIMVAERDAVNARMESLKSIEEKVQTEGGVEKSKSPALLSGIQASMNNLKSEKKELERALQLSQNQVSVPEELKYQGRFIVPRSGFSAFRPFTKSDQPHDFFHQYRQMVASLSAPLTVGTQEEARKEWGRAGEYLKDHLMWQQQWDQPALRRYHELITAPVTRFEWASARSLGTITATYVGGILFLDLLGGYVGMALLKLRRRRRAGRIGLGA